MNELISIFDSTINSKIIKTVNARDLHQFLDSKQDFSTWMKNRIEQYDFVENQDFIVLHRFMENPQGGRPAIDYHISLNMAKELSMVEKTSKGKEARQYFINCEEELINRWKSMSLAEVVSYSINKLVEQERQITNIENTQKVFDSRITQIESEASRLRSHSDMYTVMGFCNLVKFSLSMQSASKIGKAVTKYCKANNIRIDTTGDARVGNVNVYPIDTLITVCSVLYPSHNFNII